jgi:citrate lyase subunit beta/citryl-CoA lyase
MLEVPIRTMLFVPGHRESWIQNARSSGADALVLDLEDSVPQGQKAVAREIVARQIDKHSAQDGRLYVRINRGKYLHDIKDITAVAKPGIAGLFVPMVGGLGDIEFLSSILSELEYKQQLMIGTFSLIVALETAKSIHLAFEIALCPRVQAIVACTAKNADVARSLGFTWSPEGLETLHYRSRAIMSSRAAGKQFPIGGLWQDVHDLEGLKAFAENNRRLGFSGEIVLHPSNVPIINEVYSLSSTDKEYYEGMIEAFEDAETKGQAALMYRGEHIDIAHVTTAREILSRDHHEK